MRTAGTPLLLFVLCLAAAPLLRAADAPPSGMAGARPNIIFVLADDLGYADVGCYGSKTIKTPSLDRMAAEGMKFTHAYSGTSVCAPTRCILMTGLHAGHAFVRANREHKPEGQEPMPADTYTVAHLLKGAGYATAAMGKWGLGYPGSASTPDKMGFDTFYGYNCQREAHSYFPKHLYHNDQQVPLDGKTYSHDLIEKETLDWIRAHKDGPFFFYAAYTLPHGKYEIPPQYEAMYEGANLPPRLKTYAAMVTRFDTSVGRILDLLKELKIDDRTLVIFTSDNGTADVKLSPEQPFRGIKRSVYEGGIRTAAIARWPGRINPGSTNDTPWAHWDFLPTAAELSGAKVPDRVRPDGLSILPLLAGGTLPERDLYFELHEGKFIQALRRGDWKVVRPGPSAPLELYNLKADPKEQTNLAAEKPEVLKDLQARLAAGRVDSEAFPIKPAPKPGTRKPAAAKPAAANQ